MQILKKQPLIYIWKNYKEILSIKNYYRNYNKIKVYQDQKQQDSLNLHSTDQFLKNKIFSIINLFNILE